LTNGFYTKKAQPISPKKVEEGNPRGVETERCEKNRQCKGLKKKEKRIKVGKLGQEVPITIIGEG